MLRVPYTLRAVGTSSPVQSRVGLCPLKDIRGGARMKTSCVVVLMTFVVACGGEALNESYAPPETPAAESKVQVNDEAMMSAVIMPYYPLHLEFWNASAHERTCQFSYSYHDWDMTTKSGSLVAASPVAADGWVTGTISVPLNQTATITAACWYLVPPETVMRGSNSLTTLPMRESTTCRAIYTEDGTSQTVAIPCWET